MSGAGWTCTWCGTFIPLGEVGHTCQGTLLHGALPIPPANIGPCPECDSLRLRVAALEGALRDVCEWPCNPRCGALDWGAHRCAVGREVPVGPTTPEAVAPSPAYTFQESGSGCYRDAKGKVPIVIDTEGKVHLVIRNREDVRAFLARDGGTA